MYFYSSRVFECFKGKNKIVPSDRGEYEIGDTYNWLVDNGGNVEVAEYTGKWLDPGKFDDWIEANQYLLDAKLTTCISGEVVEGSRMENRICLGAGSKLIKSKIRGPVIIGNNVQIRNSYIGPFTSISDNVVIENSHIENSVIMEGVKIINVEAPIDSSLIGVDTEVVRSDGPTKTHQLFVGNKCQIKL